MHTNISGKIRDTQRQRLQHTVPARKKTINGQNVCSDISTVKLIKRKYISDATEVRKPGAIHTQITYYNLYSMNGHSNLQLEEKRTDYN